MAVNTSHGRWRHHAGSPAEGVVATASDRVRHEPVQEWPFTSDPVRAAAGYLAALTLIGLWLIIGALVATTLA